MNIPTHPLAVQAGTRLDILYGGSEREVLKESIALSRDLMTESLGKEDHILYINTLVSTQAFEFHERRAKKDVAQNRRFLSLTLLQDALAEDLEFLTKTIEEKNVRVVILNGFEFSAMTSRHRIEIFFWLKSVRDVMGARVVVFTQSGPRSYGTLGQMRFVSETCQEVGAYIRKPEEDRLALEAARQKEIDDAEAARPKLESETLYAKIKKNPDGTPMYNYDRQKLQSLREKEAATALASQAAQENETLKTKELEGANVAS